VNLHPSLIAPTFLQADNLGGEGMAMTLCMRQASRSVSIFKGISMTKVSALWVGLACLSLGSAGAADPQWTSKDVALAHPQMVKGVPLTPVKVPKALGTDGYTVAQVAAQRSELKDKSVLVAGQVVKFNAGIMGRNWVHLRDGSGNEANQTNDLLVTTQELAKVGDILTVRGTVRSDKDFGAGYAYKVLLEDAKIVGMNP
jgi:hypothetical protein